MKDVEQIARDRLPVLRDALLVHAPLERRDQLVAVLLDHEADQLLASPPSDRSHMQNAKSRAEPSSQRQHCPIPTNKQASPQEDREKSASPA